MSTDTGWPENILPELSKQVCEADDSQLLLYLRPRIVEGLRELAESGESSESREVAQNLVVLCEQWPSGDGSASVPIDNLCIVLAG